MRETVADFTRSTGIAYDPPEFVTRQARALGPNDALPTLFRFPGPCGLVEEFLQGIETLAPAAELWAADRPVNSEARGVTHFGTIALLRPLRFSFAAERPGIWVGKNAPIPRDELVWIPPSAVHAPIPWDSIATAEQAGAQLGDTTHEREVILAALSLYREELDAVAAAGLPGREIRWCDRPDEERARLLAEAGLTPRWTGRSATRTA